MEQAGPGADSITARWGKFVAASHWPDIPAAVWHEAKRSILKRWAARLARQAIPTLMH